MPNCAVAQNNFSAEYDLLVLKQDKIVLYLTRNVGHSLLISAIS